MSSKTEMLLNPDKLLTLKQEAELFPIRQEKRLEIITQVLSENGIAKRREVPTREQMAWEKRILDEGLTIENYNIMHESGLPEKMIIQIAFGGNRGDYLEFKKLVAASDYQRELKLVSNNKHPIFLETDDVLNFYMVNEDGAKEAHAESYSPIISSHKDRGGSSTSYSPRSSFQDIVKDMSNNNKLAPTFSLKTLKAELETEYGLIPDKVLKRLLKEINKGILEFEEKIIHSTSEDAMTSKALETISDHCLKNHINDYEISNKYGDDARKMVNTIGPELGKLIGKKITSVETDEDTEEVISSLTKQTLKIGCKVYQKPVDEMIPYVINVLTKMMRKSN